MSDHEKCKDKLHCSHMPPPDSRSFAVGDRLVSVKELHPKIPVGTEGEIIAVEVDINQLTIRWASEPGGRITCGSPTNGYEKVAT